jgi:hypothetical protein
MLEATKLLRISHLPVFSLSYFKLAVSHLGSKFEQWLMGAPNTTLRLKAAHATQNSMLQPTELLQISYLPAFLLSHFKITVPPLGSKFEWWCRRTDLSSGRQKESLGRAGA